MKKYTPRELFNTLLLVPEESPNDVDIKKIEIHDNDMIAIELKCNFMQDNWMEELFNILNVKEYTISTEDKNLFLITMELTDGKR